MSDQLTPEAWAEEACKDSGVTTQELDTLAVKWREAWDKHDEVDALKKELYAAAMELDGKLVEAMQLAGKSKYHVEGIGTFGFTDRMSIPTPKTIEDKQKLAKYLEEVGGKTLFWDKFTVNSQGLPKMWEELKLEWEKKCLDAGKPEEIPLFQIPGLNAPTAMRSLRLTKEKKK